MKCPKCKTEMEVQRVCEGCGTRADIDELGLLLEVDALKAEVERMKYALSVFELSDKELRKRVKELTEEVKGWKARYIADGNEALRGGEKKP